MEREQLDRLLAEYATGGLSAEEKKALFAAALTDQELFDQLMEEDALREAIELPGVRNRLIDSLQEEEVMVPQAVASSVLRMPAAPAPVPVAKRAPMWLAWAAGIGVVFVSGAATYMLFEGPDMSKLARNDAPRDAKPFVPPASAVAQQQKPKSVVVDAPPKIVAENRGPVAMPPAVNIPLPSAPPPPSPAVAAEAVVLKETRAADKVMTATRNEQRDTTQTDFRAAPQQQPVAAPAVALARRQSAPSAGGGAAVGSVVATEEKAKKSAETASVWRQSGDGVWARVPAGDAIGRTETVEIRYTLRVGTSAVLRDGRGRVVLQKDGRVGDELELAVPAAALARGSSVTLTVSEAPSVPPLRIILRLR